MMLLNVTVFIKAIKSAEPGEALALPVFKPYSNISALIFANNYMIERVMYSL